MFVCLIFSSFSFCIFFFFVFVPLNPIFVSCFGCIRRARTEAQSQIGFSTELIVITYRELMINDSFELVKTSRRADVFFLLFILFLSLHQHSSVLNGTGKCTLLESAVINSLLWKRDSIQWDSFETEKNDLMIYFFFYEFISISIVRHSIALSNVLL